MTETRLTELGWTARFAEQVAPADADLVPYRISEIRRDRATGLGTDPAPRELIFRGDMGAGELAVGDWVLVEADTARIARILERATLLQRKAAGIEIKPQLIAANVDVLFITTSCNEDFSVPRLERYLALAFEAGCAPVIVITKADTCADPAPYIDAARAISPRIADVIALNAKDPDQLAPLHAYLGAGQTVAFIGSSGVGKSTLIKRLTGLDLATGGIREDDAKGRHTTTHRALYPLDTGGLVIDMPGMRELALMEVSSGLDDLFEDIVNLSLRCKFRDCAHEGEPGCAVRAAIEDGTLDAERYARFLKLKSEDAYHSETVQEARARGKAFGKMVKSVKKTKRDKFRR